MKILLKFKEKKIMDEYTLSRLKEAEIIGINNNINYYEINIIINLKSYFENCGSYFEIPENFDFIQKLKNYKQKGGYLGHYGEKSIGQLISFEKNLQNNEYLLTFNIYPEYMNIKFNNITIGLNGINIFAAENEFGKIIFMYYENY